MLQALAPLSSFAFSMILVHKLGCRQREVQIESGAGSGKVRGRTTRGVVGTHGRREGEGGREARGGDGVP